MERIIIDMDEVIADPMGAMVSWYEDQYKLKVDYANIKNGSWVRGFPTQHHELVLERLHGPGFFRDLPVMDDAVDVLKEMNQRYEIFIVSKFIKRQT
jgi:5'(3')-deoxyribonucleotidase